jgi:hypothetical protein
MPPLPAPPPAANTLPSGAIVNCTPTATGDPFGNSGISVSITAPVATSARLMPQLVAPLSLTYKREDG